jgi:glutamine amidotransferase class I
VNNRFRRRLEDAGLVCSGTSPDGRLVEIVELPDHPWFVAGQFHPEFRSRPTRPHPLFREFVGAATALADARDRAAQPVPAARVPARNGADRDRAEPDVAAPGTPRRPDGADWRPATDDAGTPEEKAPRPARPSAAAGRTVDLREDRTGPPPAPAAGEEPSRTVPSAPDPTAYRRGDGEPEPEPEPRAGGDGPAVPTDPVTAGEPGRP